MFENHILECNDLMFDLFAARVTMNMVNVEEEIEQDWSSAFLVFLPSARVYDHWQENLPEEFHNLNYPRSNRNDSIEHHQVNTKRKIPRQFDGSDHCVFVDEEDLHEFCFLSQKCNRLELTKIFLIIMDELIDWTRSCRWNNRRIRSTDEIIRYRSWIFQLDDRLVKKGKKIRTIPFERFFSSVSLPNLDRYLQVMMDH